MLEDPKVNFYVSFSNDRVGINHLGIQAESEEELKEIYANITNADAVVYEDGHTAYCYSKSEKSWVKDRQNVEWEAFYAYGESETKSIDDPTSRKCCEADNCA